MTRVGLVIVRRLGAGALTVLTMILLTFVLFWTIPNTPSAFVYPTAQHLTSYQITHADQLLGLDRSKPDQVLSYLSHIVRGDFGGAWSGVQVIDNSKLVMQPIGPRLFSATGVSASIVLGGALLVLLLSLPLGAIAARYEGRTLDRLISLLTLLAICTHPMIVGLILRTIFADKLNWLPTGGYCSLSPFHAVPIGPYSGPQDYSIGCGGPGPWAEHLILPWISFALLFVALYTRMTRASVLDTLHEDFVRTARAKGAGETRVMRSHVLPNAGLRVLTMIGMEIATALGIVVYIESAFGMPGLGRLAVSVMVGTVGLDLPQILAVVTMVTLVVVVGNVVVDSLYAIFDPRAGTSSERSRRFGGLVI